MVIAPMGRVRPVPQVRNWANDSLQRLHRVVRSDEGVGILVVRLDGGQLAGLRLVADLLEPCIGQRVFNAE